ncbi:hypothetical protein J6590_035148 [Homalodisca vitripennis]|nr:hypothetical protein J6590_035148 [Homalodisca vitripennis]
MLISSSYSLGSGLSKVPLITLLVTADAQLPRALRHCLRILIPSATRPRFNNHLVRLAVSLSPQGYEESY